MIFLLFDALLPAVKRESEDGRELSLNNKHFDNKLWGSVRMTDYSFLISISLFITVVTMDFFPNDFICRIYREYTTLSIVTCQFDNYLSNMMNFHVSYRVWLASYFLNCFELLYSRHFKTSRSTITRFYLVKRYPSIVLKAWYEFQFQTHLHNREIRLLISVLLWFTLSAERPRLLCNIKRKMERWRSNLDYVKLRIHLLAQDRWKLCDRPKESLDNRAGIFSYFLSYLCICDCFECFLW